MRPSQRKAGSPKKKAAPTEPVKPAIDETISHLRSQAHDLSNALEAILQASYLLSQAKLDENSHRWVRLIDSSSQDAARINREIRKSLRALSGD